MVGGWFLLACACVRRQGAVVALAAALAGGVVAAVPAAVAQPVPDPLIGLRIEEAQRDGRLDEALRLIEAALAASDDPRFVEDLLARKAELLSKAGRHAEAADALEAQAHSIALRAGEAAPALIPVLDALAAARAEAGDRAAAVDAVAHILEILPAAGLLDRADGWLRRLDGLAAGADAGVAARAAAAALAFEEAREAGARDVFGEDPENGSTKVKIWYATDRARTGSAEPADFYGGDRGDLELGSAVVSIPPQHLPGKIERPSVWTLEFREDPGRHVVLQSVTPGEADAVFADMRGQLAATGSEAAFVFVHGFNVPFAEAAQRTAQMAYDMNFDGVPILYSWPSRGSVLSYIADTAVVNLSGRRLSLFLEDVVRKSGATRIHLIAHSMGNRALTDALELYALRHEGEPPAFDQVLFTAPDLDADLFAEMARTMRTAAQRLTLYASDKDWALAVSRKLHGDATRAGQGGRGILHSGDVDSIDMTSIGEDMLMHSYYANNPSALSDILSLLWRDAPPEDRCGMTRATGEHGAYWEYVPAECDSSALLSTLSFLRKAGISSLPEAQRLFSRFVPTDLAAGERSRLEAALARLFRR